MPAAATANANPEPFARERLAPHPVAGGVLEPAKIVIQRCDIWMPVTYVPFQDVERTLIRFTGFGEARQVLVADTQIVQRCGDLQSIPAKRLLDKPNGPRQNARRLLIASGGQERRAAQRGRPRQGFAAAHQ
jgi:hypothetical protein